MFFDWRITCLKVEWFFSHQEISFHFSKSFINRGFVPPLIGQEVVSNVPKDSKLVLIIDEPTPFLDWELADEFTKQLIDLLTKYSSQIQLILSTQELAPYSEYFNFMQLPG